MCKGSHRGARRGLRYVESIDIVLTLEGVGLEDPVHTIDIYRYDMLKCYHVDFLTLENSQLKLYTKSPLASECSPLAHFIHHFNIINAHT